MQSDTGAKHFKNLSDRADWRWQMKHRIRTVGELRDLIDLTPEEEAGIRTSAGVFRWGITPYYASLMDRSDPQCPVRRQVIPHIDEMEDDIDLMAADPLEEEAHSPVKNLIHNYEDRVAICVSSECAANCRFCLRKRMTGSGVSSLKRKDFQPILDYLSFHTEIRDVLLTGGDPLSLDDDHLAWLLMKIRAIPHIDIIRIGSRYPVLNPFRITPGLCNMLAGHHPVWFNTHFNHPKEITPQSARALDLLSRAGIPLGNQTVLLKGINDNSHTLRELFHKLVTYRVRPYYLYQAQLLGGTRHFRTTIEHGMQLMESLRGTLSGFAIPLYVLDTPYGKVPLTPSGFRGRSGDYVTVQSYRRHIWKEYNPLPGKKG